jgi:hypothetical protein
VPVWLPTLSRSSSALVASVGLLVCGAGVAHADERVERRLHDALAPRVIDGIPGRAWPARPLLDEARAAVGAELVWERPGGTRGRGRDDLRRRHRDRPHARGLSRCGRADARAMALRPRRNAAGRAPRARGRHRCGVVARGDRRSARERRGAPRGSRGPRNGGRFDRRGGRSRPRSPRAGHVRGRRTGGRARHRLGVQ